MKKEEFLKKLEKRLSILNETERKDILDEYSDHIDKKIQSGMTEEEAVKDFGDFETLVKDILSAYKINEEYSKEGKVENTFNVIVDEMVQFFQRLARTLNHKRGEDLLRIICKFILVLFVIWLLRIPTWIIQELGESIFSVFPGYLDHLLSISWNILIEAFYVIASVLVIYNLVKKMIFEEEEVNEVENKGKIKEAKTEPVKKATEKKSSKEETRKKVIADTDTKPDYSSMIVNPILVIVKIFAVLFTLPILVGWVGLMIALGVMIALAIKGIYLVSIFFIMIGLILMATAVLGIIYRVVLKGVKE